MTLVSEISLLDFFTKKLKLNEVDAREAVTEYVKANAVLEREITTKIDDRFMNLKEVFLTKDDKVDLVGRIGEVKAEIHKSKSDVELIIRHHLYWTVGIGVVILGVIITYSNIILTRLPATIQSTPAIHQVDTSTKK